MGGSAHRCPPCGCVLGKWASASTCSRPASLQSGAPNFPEEHTLRAWTSLRHRDLVSSCFPPRDVDCGRAATISPRLAVAHRVELEKHYLLFFFSYCTTPGPIPTQCAQVQTALLNRDCTVAAPGFSLDIIDFNLETKVTDLLELLCSMTCKVGSEVIFGKL